MRRKLVGSEAVYFLYSVKSIVDIADYGVMKYNTTTTAAAADHTVTTAHPL